MRLFRKRDLIVIAVLILILILTASLKPEIGSFSNKVVVEIDGREHMVIDRPGEYPVVVDGERVTTVVYDGTKVRVRNSNCPLKICEKMGWVKPGGEIICVPNKLVVRFERSRVDTMTW